MEIRTSFWATYWSYVVRPRRTADALVADYRRVRFGAFAVLIPAAGYTSMYLLASIAGGAPSSFSPWLAIPKEVYFKYDVFIVAPSMFACWVLASGVAQLVSRLFSGSGSFEDTAAVLGFGIGIATWSSLVHDLTDAALGALGVIDMRQYERALNEPTVWRAILWALYSIYLAWFILLFSKGMGAAHKTRHGSSLLMAITAFIIYQGFYLVFNR